MLKRKQFEHCINYLFEVEKAIMSVNVKFGFDDNDMLYAYVFENKKNGTIHYQFCRNRKSSVDRQWNLNIYFDKKDGNEELEKRSRYYAETVDELWNKLVDAKIVKEVA